MHKLGVPTTRALAAVTTGEPVVRERVLPGGVITRVAASFVRVGTFEYFAARDDYAAVKQLADYVIAKNNPQLGGHQQPYVALLDAVVERLPVTLSLAGLALALAMPGPGIWPLAFVFPVLLLEGLERSRSRWQPWLLGWLAGTVHWLVATSWVYDVMHHYGGLAAPAAVVCFRKRRRLTPCVIFSFPRPAGGRGRF